MTNRTQLASDEILNGTILTVWLVEPADSPSPWSSCGRSDPRRSPPATIPSWRRRCADWWQMPAPSWPRSRHAGGDDHRHVSCLRSQTLALEGLSVSVRMGVSQGAGCGQRIRKRASLHADRMGRNRGFTAALIQIQREAERQRNAELAATTRAARDAERAHRAYERAQTAEAKGTPATVCGVSLGRR
jgi:hypothetical protein